MKKHPRRKSEPKIWIMYAFEGEDGKPREARTDAERRRLDEIQRDHERADLWPVVWARALRPTFERWSRDELKEIAEFGKMLHRFSELIEENFFDGDGVGNQENLAMMLTSYLDLVDEINKPMMQLAEKSYKTRADLTPRKREKRNRRHAAIRKLVDSGQLSTHGFQDDQFEQLWNSLPPEVTDGIKRPSRRTVYRARAKSSV